MEKVEYRNQVLKITPWVCAKCGPDFAGKKLKELTAHHKGHNYRHNPPDDSNVGASCAYTVTTTNTAALWMPGG